MRRRGWSSRTRQERFRGRMASYSASVAVDLSRAEDGRFKVKDEAMQPTVVVYSRQQRRADERAARKAARRTS
jgi:uncharacterized circularly permuted ATP-grasp superfamily protein